MKQKIIVLLMVFCPIGIFGQTWDYPAKPGTEEWKKLKTGKEKNEACQIPENVLKKISSHELAYLCMKYPLFFEYTALEDQREAIVRMIKQFNGLKELSTRKDGARVLMETYSRMKVQDKEGYIEKGAYSSVLHFEYIELLLSSDIFQDKLNAMEQQKLKEITISKYTEKLKHIDIYGGDGIRKSLLLSSILMLRTDPSQKNDKLLEKFIRNYDSVGNKELESISKINTQNNGK